MLRKKKITIAICYDFDGTLIEGNMQENSFIPNIGMKKADFWQAVDEHAEKNNMDRILSYMMLMLEKARENGLPFNKEALASHGKEVKFFNGVRQWFSEINNYSDKANIEHYIISSGIDEMIRKSAIGREFEYIFASGFVYDANNAATFPARSINYTTKTQYLFRINKGIKNCFDDESVNKFTTEDERPIPFSRMIYIGDGATDVPAMKMVNYKGGYSIAVYPPKTGVRATNKEKSKKKEVEELQENNRCNFIAEADYTKDKPLYKIVTALINRIVDEQEYAMNLKAK